MLKKIFISSGGTGGHIIPAISLAKYLQKQGHQIWFYGDIKSKNFIKSTDNLNYNLIPSAQFVKNIFGLINFSIKTLLGFFKSLVQIIKYRPDYIIAFGGYSTFPILLAGVFSNSKIILHEQNAHLGKVNRLFAKFAFKICLSFEKTDGINPLFQSKTTYTGNPIRDEIIALNSKTYTLPKNESFAIKTENKFGYDILLNSDFNIENVEKKYFKILVIGGSGGAKIFSDILPKAFYNFSENIKEQIQIFQQCRAELVESTFNQYKSFNLNIVVDSYFEDMATLIDEAHLIIARAGSSSIFEFCCAKKPMILVPFAESADDHQQKNANYLNQNGACIMVKEIDFNIKNINEILNNLLNNTNILFELSKNAGNLALINANNNISKIIN